MADMDHNEILERLKANESALRARGVTRAVLFGSRARGEDEPGSDTDILIETDPRTPMTIFDYAGLKDYVAGLLGGPVDVVRRDRLKPYLAAVVAADAICAF